MTIKQFIEKAIEGGWNMSDYYKKFGYQGEDIKEVAEYLLDHNNTGSVSIHKVLLDSLAWQAVGKVEGWEVWDTGYYTVSGNHIVRQGYTLQMHRMIDALAEGKTIEEFLKTL